jgi:hypothetical protein
VGTRAYLYGYAVDEVDLGGVTWDDAGRTGQVTSIATSNPHVRMPECVALPSRVEGAVFFRPTTNDPLSSVQGLKKRLVHRRPPVDVETLKEFQAFVEDFLTKNFTPLNVDEVDSFEDWLEQVNHPRWRKDEYQVAWDRLHDEGVSTSKIRRKKVFVKREFYNEPKFQRCIHSPSDYEKVLHGRFVSAIEKKIFAMDAFIKKKPRSEWPAFVRDMIGTPGWLKILTDYKSFEANFVPEIQESCEMQVVKFFLELLFHDPSVQDMLAQSGLKILDSTQFAAWILGRRHSGQMATSLFNGISNYLFGHFFCRKRGATEVRCIIEGDDGIFCHNGPENPTPEDFLQLGLTIKLEPVEEWNTASFCGVVTHPDVLDVLCDPWKAVLTASWAGHSYLRARDPTLIKLAQIKGLSYLAQYHGCPVVQSLGLWLLRTTGFERERLEDLLIWYENQVGVGWWEKQVAFQIRHSSVDAKTVMSGSRRVVAQVFKVSEETQLYLENLFDGSHEQVVCLDPAWVPKQYVENWHRFVRYDTRLSKDLALPGTLPAPEFPENLLPYDRGTFSSPDLRYRGRRRV